MADEAFALSPITAEAPAPSDADYDAIHDVFMETSRGRWFLSEFARRNRNADTRMVLDAVARIEQTIATSKPLSPGDLTETLASIRTAIESAKADAKATLSLPASDEHLALAYKCVRAVREVAWTLRECGSDSRICDKLDMQANTIDRSLDQFAAGSTHNGMLAIFDKLTEQLDELAGSDASSHPASKSPSISDDVRDITALAAPAEASGMVIESSAETKSVMGSIPSTQQNTVAAEAAVPDHKPSDIVALDPPAIDIDSTSRDVSDAAPTSPSDEADDIAVLDMIAIEMAAPDPDEFDDVPLAIDEGPDIDDDLEPAPQYEIRLNSDTHNHESLGAALLASGTIRQPGLPGTGRFAAIQRLSQIEKVALFS